MSRTEEQGTSPGQGAYPTPDAVAVGRVEEVTGGAGPHYSDGTGHYQEKKSRVEAPAGDEG